jgi:short-subunit dehydrogenase involved in D-alanine esterification of teichoic acids
MRLAGNTILITGGGSGTGRGLAEAFHGLGNQVIIKGRRLEVLERMTPANTEMRAVVLDMDAPEASSFQRHEGTKTIHSSSNPSIVSQPACWIMAIT